MEIKFYRHWQLKYAISNGLHQIVDSKELQSPKQIPQENKRSIKRQNFGSDAISLGLESTGGKELIKIAVFWREYVRMHHNRLFR